MFMYDEQLQNGDHILITDVGLENNDGLVCWVNRKITTPTFRWHLKKRTDLANEVNIEKFKIIRGWYSHSWFNVVPHLTLTRRPVTPATEGILTCKDPTCDFCSSVSLEVHYPSELYFFSFYPLKL